MTGRDYVLYIHGVNVRDPDYYRAVDTHLQKSFSYNLTTASVFWGDLGNNAEAKLFNQWRSSPIWDQMWFPEMRGSMLLQLLGDGALYVSRSIGAAIVHRIHEAVVHTFRGTTPADRLHVVAHSWGAVIVLDVLFAGRWNDKKAPGYQEVRELRDGLFGMGGHDGSGIRLATISTLGSPMSLFSLMDGDFADHDDSSHDITATMQTYCRKLYKATNIALPWWNFVHPGDAFAYPSAPLITSMLGDDSECVHAVDQLIKPTGVLAAIIPLIAKNDLSLLTAGDAHNGYWSHPEVSTGIENVMRMPMQTSSNVHRIR